MYHILLTIAFAIMILRGDAQMAKWKNSRTVQETMSTMKRFDEASKLWGRVNPMFFDLYDIQELYDTRPEILNTIIFFQELVKENDNDGYIPLRDSVINTRDKIKSIVSTLLSMEQKAVVCRGMRHALPMIAYSIFVNHKIHGPTANPGRGEQDIFDELFTTKFPNDMNSIRFETFSEIMKQREDDDGNSIAANETKVTETQIGFIEKIKTVFETLKLFAGGLFGFGDIIRVLQTMNSTAMTVAGDAHHGRLMSIFRKVEKMYRTECFAGADAAWLLGAENAGNVPRGELTVPELTEEIDRLFGRIRLDLGLLTVKFHPVNAGQLDMTDVSIVYHHAVNKYYDPAVWRLIGDERLVDESGDTLQAVALNDVMAGYVGRIDESMDAVVESMKRTVRCRCYLYMNLFMKLYRYVVQWLAENAAELRHVYGKAGRLMADAKKYSAGKGSDQFQQFFEEFMYEAKQLKVRGRPKFGDTTDRDYVELLSMVDELNRGGVDNDEIFKTVAAVYLQFCAASIDSVVDNIDYYLLDMEFGMEFYPMASDLRRTAVTLNRQTVLALAKWYAWGERIYADDHCFPVEDHQSPTLNYAMKRVLSIQNSDVSMDWLKSSYEQLNQKLEADLEQSIIWDY